ncbi:JmjC domain-containing protein, partial [Terfezia claveryi]
SEKKVTGIHTPYFYFASPASVFAMHMEDYAALSINYHHWGAPKRWIICCPADSEKLENLVVGMLGLKTVGCDQFVRHASVFVPTWVLERAGVRFTKVLQENGDMIITFPWAYHEGWNQGLNVAEAIGYGDVDWERWVRGYRVC